MFQKLRENRSLLMGLAVCGVAFFHTPFVIHDPWVGMLHNTLNSGVELFLFFSGIGACHSIQRRGGGGYLRQRAARLLPGLYLFLIPWCAVMAALGYMTGREVLGSVTLLGWWLGQSNQLNWYFSAVWMFFLLAVPLYALFRRTEHPVLLWLGLTVLSVLVGILCPLDYLMTAVARLPIFLTGMLFGRLEQTGFRRTGLLRGILIALMPAGLLLVTVVYWSYGWGYGYKLGLWWYPYALVVPGAAVLLADLFSWLRRFRPMARLMRPLEWCGESSAEILMVHVGIYKLIQNTTKMRNRYWLCTLLGCLVLGCLYHYFVTSRLRRPSGGKFQKLFSKRY